MLPSSTYRYPKTTRQAVFLAEMERVVTWSAPCELIAPFYLKPGNGRPPVAVDRLLRLYFLQHWFNLSALEEALSDSQAMRGSLLTSAASRCPARRRRLTADVGAFQFSR